MPAILRKFLPNNNASPYDIRPYAFFGSVVGSGHRGQDVSGRRLATRYPTVGSNSICGTTN